jgi:putative ABC transport system permease protein
VFVPLVTLDLSLGEGDGGNAVEEIVLHLPGRDVIRAGGTIRQWLDAALGASAATVTVVVPRELLHARLRAARSFHVLLIAIGSVVLAVSGVGIMNIMVAAVTERAHEIGIRRAVGARRSTIVGQFAVEAGLLGSLGGVAGAPLGIIAAVVVARLAEWPIAVSAVSLAGAVALGVVVGLVAAIYPARLAAVITPIDAIRQE